MAVKKAELAIPLAFLSHFALDLIPHYNPPGITREKFKSYADNWGDKFRDRSFRIIFPLDMLLLILVVFGLPLLAPSNVSPWAVGFAAVAGAAPDFDGGIRFLLSRAGMRFDESRNWFGKFHVGLQWMERPWGIYVELVWLAFLIWAMVRLIS